MVHQKVAIEANDLPRVHQVPLRLQSGNHRTRTHETRNKHAHTRTHTAALMSGSNAKKKKERRLSSYLFDVVGGSLGHEVVAEALDQRRQKELDAPQVRPGLLLLGSTVHVHLSLWLVT